MMKIHYNVVINDRQLIAEDYADRMEDTSIYQKSSKCYIVGKVRFLKHGMIEGLKTKRQVDVLIELLKDWDFADEASRTEYDNLPVEEPIDPVSLTISIPNEGITDEIHTMLVKLVCSHSELLRKALGTDGLDIKTAGEELQFPWFRYPYDDEEQTAYYDLVNHLVDKAKTTKIVYDPVKGDEKYVFSRFLYRIGIDGNSRKTREILMKNLAGNAWKNLSWHKKKAKRDELKKAV